MRKFILQQWVTVDNIAAQENGGMSFVAAKPFDLTTDEDIKASVMEFIDTVDTMILGACGRACFTLKTLRLNSTDTERPARFQSIDRDFKSAPQYFSEQRCIELPGRRYYDNRSAKVNVGVVKSSVKNPGHSAANS